jgi:hypothetical protein
MATNNRDLMDMTVSKRRNSVLLAEFVPLSVVTVRVARFVLGLKCDRMIAMLGADAACVPAHYKLTIQAPAFSPSIQYHTALAL